MVCSGVCKATLPIWQRILEKASAIVVARALAVRGRSLLVLTQKLIRSPKLCSASYYQVRSLSFVFVAIKNLQKFNQEVPVSPKPLV